MNWTFTHSGASNAAEPGNQLLVLILLSHFLRWTSWFLNCAISVCVLWKIKTEIRINVSPTIFINPLGKTLTISFREKIVKYKMLRKMRILDKIMWRMIISILYPLVINSPVPKSFKSSWLYVGGYWFQIFEKGLVEMSFKKKHPHHCGKRIWDYLRMVWMWGYLRVTGTHNPEDSPLSTATTFICPSHKHLSDQTMSLSLSPFVTVPHHVLLFLGLKMCCHSRNSDSCL